MLVYTWAKYKICEFFVLRKISPLASYIHASSTCFALILIHVSEGLIACLFHARTSYVHQVWPWQSPNSSKRSFRLFYFPTFQEPHLPIHTNTNTCMSHQISESFLLFSFSRVHDCIHYPCKGAAVSQCQPNLASCHNVKFWFLIKRTRDLSWSPFLMFPFFLPIFLLDF